LRFVHIALMGHEEDRIIEGIRRYPANKLILIRNRKEYLKDDYLNKIETETEMYQNKILEKIGQIIPFEIKHADFIDFINGYEDMLEIILPEMFNDQTVIVNVSGGTRVLAFAVFFISLILPINSFYIIPEKYEEPPKGAKRFIKIPRANIPVPKDVKKAIINIIYRQKNKTFQSISKLTEGYNELYRKNLTVYNIFYHLKFLEAQEMVSLERKGRKSEIKLLNYGELMGIYFLKHEKFEKERI